MNARAICAISLLAFVSACSSKKSTSTPQSETKSTAETTQKKFFAEIHLLAETKTAETCTNARRLTEIQLQPTTIEVTSAMKLSSQTPIKKYGINFDLELIGHDTSRYQFTSIDGLIPSGFPFPIKIRRVPGMIVELSYLNTVTQIKVKGAPVYSFTATENRDGCQIEHNVNIYTDQAGMFEVEQ